MPQETDELHLLNEWRVPGEERRTVSAGVLSLLVHVAGFLILISLPKSAFTPPVRHELRHVFIPLVAPPRELTQKDPNKGKVGHEFNLENLMPRPPVEPRVSPPSSTQPAARLSAPPAPFVAESRPAPVIPPPQIQAPPAIQMNPDKIAQAPPLGSQPNAPPPPPVAAEKPKLAFEKPGSMTGRAVG